MKTIAWRPLNLLIIALALASTLALCLTHTFAKMYKWVDQNGQVHVSDKKPTGQVYQLNEYGKDIAKQPEEAHPQYELDLKILGIKIKYLRRYGKFVDFSLRLDVRCTDPKFRGDVKAWVRALDRKGFELATATAQGKIGPGSRGALSGTNYWRYKLYRQVNKWEITNITFD